MHGSSGCGRSLHTLAWIAGVLGALALVGAWFAGSASLPVFGLDQPHLFSDAQSLFLLGIFLFMAAKACVKGHGGEHGGEMVCSPGEECGCGGNECKCG